MAHPQTKGPCVFCGREMTRSGLTRHFASCSQRREAVEQADARSGGEQEIYHLLVRDAFRSEYWLHLEMNGKSPLGELDNYLRAIWLECCGHMSQFSIGGWRGDEINMNLQVRRIFKPGLELTHIYDFGTSSETLVKVLDVRRGKPLSDRPIFLMARNKTPQGICADCDKPASWYCQECGMEYDLNPFLCDEHAKTHPCDDIGDPIALVNSPRLGLCGYTGPAKAPY